MKKIIILSLAFMAIVVASAQITPSKVLKGGEKTIIYELLPGDCVIAIPIVSKKINIPSGDDGKITTDGIAVTIYYQRKPTEMAAERQFVPYKLSCDTLWIILPKELRANLKIASQNFTGNINNPARIEVWNDPKLIGDLPKKHPTTDSGVNYMYMINLCLISTGKDLPDELQDRSRGRVYMSDINQYVAQENKKIFEKDYFVSKGKI